VCIVHTRAAATAAGRSCLDDLMKLTIERQSLIKALGHVQSVVERRNTIPILSNVLLSAEKGAVSFSATDLDMEIVDETSAQIATPGQITAPAHTLYEIVRKLPEGAEVELKFQGDDPRLSVSAGRSRFNLPVLPAGDFPVMSSDGLSTRVSMDTEDLIRLIDKTRFAISTEETRYYLNGLYVHTVMEDGAAKLRAVATDGHRLALAEMPAPDGALGLPGVIVPRKTIQEARRLLDDAGEMVEMQVSTAKIRFEFGRAGLTSKVIDGSFPDYVRVIPRDNQKIVRIDNGLFAQAVDRVSTISAEKSRSVKLAIETGRLTLTVRNMEAGQAVEEIEIDYDGEAFEIGFNARYLLDVCGQIGGDTMELRFADPASPTLVIDPTDAGVRYVLMPLRV
jgi:DNA polymerase III subunit beta